tara:strand:+ start:30 stop:572 length:543 start_codon:yes stop_codon:yes gene_type:complete
MAMTKNLWSINALATEFGFDRRTVGLRLSNVKPAEVKGKVKKYRLADATRALMGAVSSSEGVVSYEEARARKLAAEAELAEIELRKERLEVLEIATIDQINSEIFGNFRAKLLALPAKASPDVFAAKDVQEAKNILTKYIKDTLQELSDTMVEAYETEDTQLDTSTGSDTESPRPDEATA